MTIPTDLIDLRTACEISGRSRSTLKERIYSGRLPAWREGVEYFVRRDHVLALFAPVTPPSAPAPGALKALLERIAAPYVERGRARWKEQRQRAHLNLQ